MENGSELLHKDSHEAVDLAMETISKFVSSLRSVLKRSRSWREIFSIRVQSLHSCSFVALTPGSLCSHNRLCSKAYLSGVVAVAAKTLGLFLLLALFSHPVLAQPDYVWAILYGEKAEKQLIGTCFFVAPDTFVTCKGIVTVDSIPAPVPVTLWHPRLGSTRIQDISISVPDLDIVIGTSFSRVCRKPAKMRDFRLPSVACQAKAYAYRQDSLFRQIHNVLKSGHLVFMADPKSHTAKKAFLESLAIAEGIGFLREPAPTVRRSYSTVLRRI